MKYDRDLRILRTIAYGLMGMNLAIAAGFAFARQWIHFVASLLWAINVLGWTRSLRVQQTTRDETRKARKDAAEMLDILRDDWKAGR